IITVISFIGGPISAGFGLLVSSLVTPSIVSTLAHWIAGEAIDPNATGATYGNDINYGARLAANDQAIAAGGQALTDQESSQLSETEQCTSQLNFHSQSLAYLLVNPDDDRSLVSRLMDNVSPSVTQNVASLAHGIMNFGSYITGLPRDLFSSIVHAAPKTPYNYGFPEYGFSEAEMNNPAVENPFTNAGDVEQMLGDPSQGASSQGAYIIQQAQTCFGVTIAPTTESDGEVVWGVTGGNTVPTYASINKDSQCSDTSTWWLQVRMFIFDTEDLESVACFEGDEESCDNVDFGMSPGASDSTTTSMLQPKQGPVFGQVAKFIDNGALGKIL
ncbi:MAG: hypothetical protein ACREF7_00735, partial [Candidatus Saccharimonadales bacterium]